MAVFLTGAGVLPVFKTRLSDLSIGSSVFLNINGTPAEFLVVQQGLPSSDYDSSCDGTWLLMKDCLEAGYWDGDSNDYGASEIHTYLNNTVINRLDSGIASAIKQVKIPYTYGNGSSGSVKKGANGLSTKIFLLSFAELGLTKADSSSIDGYTANTEGAVLDYFDGTAASKRIAYYYDVARQWYLRSPAVKTTNYTWCVTTAGKAVDARASTTYHNRIALILPSTQVVDENYNVVT